jgi:hypothetical protein
VTERCGSAPTLVLVSVAVIASVGALAAGCHGGAADRAPDPGTAPDAGSAPDAAALTDAALGDAAAAADAADQAKEDGGAKVVTDSFPASALAALVGCWQLEDRERWTFTGTSRGGAEVVRTITRRDHPGGEDYVRRASMAQKIMYAPGDGSFAFTTAGPRHGLMFIFTVGPAGIEGTWYSSHRRGEYHFTGNASKLTRCGVRAGAPR